jgi:hypothetical protein
MLNEETAIEVALTAFPEAKRVAVENFVMSAPNDKKVNQRNISYDALLYGWNQDTIDAIVSALEVIGKI